MAAIEINFIEILRFYEDYSHLKPVLEELNNMKLGDIYVLKYKGFELHADKKHPTRNTQQHLSN